VLGQDEEDDTFAAEHGISSRFFGSLVVKYQLG
jgi:hypothetical protein